MKYILLLFFILTPLTSLRALVPTDSTPKANTYSKVTIITTDYEKFRVNKIILHEDFLEYLNYSTTEMDTISLNNIELISACTGNYTLTGAAMGACCGAALSLWYLVELFPASNPPAIIALSTLIGAGIGTLIGYVTNEYSTIYQSGSFFLSSLKNTTEFTTEYPHYNILSIQIPL